MDSPMTESHNNSDKNTGAPSFQSPESFAWHPTPEVMERSHLKAFMDQHGIPGFDALMERSTSDVPWFTSAVLDYLQIEFQKPYTRVIDTRSGGIQRPRWCVGGDLNIVHNCVDKWAADPETRDRFAVIAENEEGAVRKLTYAELAVKVNRCANALRGLGLGKGDAVGLFMPMTPEIVIALLAVAKIGGIILPLFSGYGAGALVTRLADAGAKALFTADGTFRRGSIVDMKAVADEAVHEVESVAHVIVFARCGNPVALQEGRDHWWEEFLGGQSDEAYLEPTAAEDLLMLIYTSGTTGRPKGAVHTHCGFPVKAAQDMAFGTDVHAGDVVHWMTDMGWMMGPWLVFGGLLLGATIFVYDGAPDFPGPERLWAMVERHRIHQLGLSPTFVRAILPHGDKPVRQHDLSSLKCFASTGEPWNPDPWRWLFETAGNSRLPIINYSGGTEISGGIVMGNPLLPVKPTAFAGPCPGIAADVVDEDGNPVRGQVGELVIRAPWIGMTRGFWRDEARYLETYWSRFEGVWVHGDWAAIDDDGQWYIFGRSDDTIKVAGKRLGPAEVESVLVQHPAVNEAAAIAVPHELKGNELVCFCVLASGSDGSEELATELQALVARQLGKPLKPRAVKFVPDLPKTRNAKVMRRVIRSAYLGEDPGDVSSLVNPEIVGRIKQSG